MPLCLVIGLIFASTLRAQVSPEDHAKHHPGGAGAATLPAAASGTAPAMPQMPASPGGTAPGGMGGMMEGMGDMMKGMGGTPTTKELYPSLMSMPELSPEKRQEISAAADERMKVGTAAMGKSLDKLGPALAANDFAAIQEATAEMRQGSAQFETGVAAHRALAEGTPPRDIALQWFRSEMSLPQPGVSTPAAASSWFHFAVMTLLIFFAAAMVAMYFFKMRRAAALFGRLDPGSGPPPPGSLPPPKPVVPPPPPGGSSAGPSPDSDPANAADKPTASTPAGGPPRAPDPPVFDSDVTSAQPPVAGNWRGQLRVGSIVTETPSVKTFRLLPSPDGRVLPFTFVPGQFLNVAFGIGGARMNRSYSISSSPTRRDYVDLTIKREPRGAVSRHIVDLLTVGDLIEAAGPVGKFTFDGTEADSIVLISAGVGITPMVSISRYLTERSWPGDIYFIYTCRTPADFMLSREIAAIERQNPKFHVAVTITKAEGTDWKGPRGRMTKEWLAQTVPNLPSRRIHICGPAVMMDATKAMLVELGVPPEQIKTELFGATKPAPAAPGTSARPTAPATGPLVKFTKNNKSAKIHTDQTVLELSEELAIPIENSCRVGTCGVCKVKLTSGEVDMAVDDSLDADDKSNGIILACQAKPRNDIAVEA